MNSEEGSVFLILFPSLRYIHDQKYDKALGIYLQLKHKKAFDLIHRHNLFDSISDKIVLLMNYEKTAAVKMFIDNMTKVPVSIHEYHVRWRCAGAQRENTKRRLLLFSYGNIICRHLSICYLLYEHTLIINIWII